MQWKGQNLRPKNQAATAMGKANPSKNTKPELNLRRELHRLGFRFRIHYAVRDGGQRPPKVDIAFPGLRLAVEVHGVFWHGRKKEYQPKHNSEYWQKKFSDNRARDKRVARRLRRAGWLLCVVWDNWSLRRQVNAVRRFYDKAKAQEGFGKVAPKIHGHGEASLNLVQTPVVPSGRCGHRRLRPSAGDRVQRLAT